MTTLTGLQWLPEYQHVQIELVNSRGYPFREGDRGGHYYRIHGYAPYPDPLPSVTTYLKVIDKSGPLIGWAKRVTLERVRATLEDWVEQSYESDENAGYIFIDSMDKIEALIEDARRRPDDVRDEAAATGHDYHRIIAQILTGEITKWSQDPAIDGALQWIKDLSLTPVAAEIPCFNPWHGCPGTVDFVGRDTEGRLVVADWKTGRGIYDEYALQVATYAVNLEALTGETVAAAYVVRLPKVQEDYPYEYKQAGDIRAAWLTSMVAQTLFASLKVKVWR